MSAEQVILLNHYVLNCGTWLWFCHLSKRNNFELHVKRANIRHKCSVSVCECVCVYKRNKERKSERESMYIQYTHNWFICNLTHEIIFLNFFWSKNIFFRHLNLQFNYIEWAVNMYYTQTASTTTLIDIDKNEQFQHKNTAHTHTQKNRICYVRKPRERYTHKKKITHNSNSVYVRKWICGCVNILFMFFLLLVTSFRLILIH